MRLGLELPTAMLREFSPLTDYDFALAQHVLDSEKYREHFMRARDEGRFVLMDNGVHETGHPLSAAELLQAADMIKPSVVIAPDVIGDYEATHRGFEEAVELMAGKYPLGLCLQGRTREQRTRLFHATYQKIAMLALPYRFERLTWIQELTETFPFIKWPPRIHLMGVKSFTELMMFRTQFEMLRVSQSRVTVDTAKPLKAAMAGRRFKSIDEDIRGLPLRSADIAALDKMTPTQRADFFFNVAFLRRFSG
jgi:hypothetical protein